MYSLLLTIRNFVPFTVSRCFYTLSIVKLLYLSNGRIPEKFIFLVFSYTIAISAKRARIGKGDESHKI